MRKLLALACAIEYGLITWYLIIGPWLHLRRHRSDLPIELLAIAIGVFILFLAAAGFLFTWGYLCKLLRRPRALTLSLGALALAPWSGWLGIVLAQNLASAIPALVVILGVPALIVFFLLPFVLAIRYGLATYAQ
jgi:hypothetical protein